MSILLALSLTACNEYDLKREPDLTTTPEEEETTPAVEEPQPDILVEPTTLDYDYLLLNCEELQVVTVSNVGEADLTVSGVSLEDGSGSVWSLEDEVEPFTLAVGESQEFRVRFQPSDEESYEARFVVASDDPDEAEVDVDALGIGALEGMLEEVFYQTPTGSTDILWVLDNSESMSDALAYLADNFEKFIDPFLELDGLDWQIAVITTDMNSTLHQGRFQGPIITPDHPDPRGAFLDAVNQGAAGSAFEVPFETIQAALTEPLISTENAGFLRDDARLTTIVVSDEDDSSGIRAVTFAGWYQSLKEDLDDTSFSAFCGNEGTGLTSCSGSGGSAAPGNKLIEVIEETDGVFFSICEDDFTEGLTLMSLDAAGMTDTFYLQAVPASIAEMEVRVAGEEPRFDNVDGWQFDWDRNAVIFYGAAIPPADSLVEITYEPEGTCI